MIMKININKIKKELLKDEVFDCILSNIKNKKIEYRKIDFYKNKKKKNKKKKVKLVKNKKVSYKNYIKSKEWKKRREEYYKKFKKECVICKNVSRVGLHHLSYKNLGREEDDDLVCLCWGCHSDYHDQYGVSCENESTHNFIIEAQQEMEMSDIIKKIM